MSGRGETMGEKFGCSRRNTIFAHSNCKTYPLNYVLDIGIGFETRRCALARHQGRTHRLRHAFRRPRWKWWKTLKSSKTKAKSTKRSRTFGPTIPRRKISSSTKTNIDSPLSAEARVAPAFFVSFPVALPRFLMFPSASPSCLAAVETVPATYSEIPPASVPTVTVIVPVRNRSGVIVRCLDSVAAQTHAAVRLIVVDNGSTDDSRSVAADWLEAHASRFLEARLLDEPRGRRQCGTQLRIAHSDKRLRGLF